MKHRFKKFLPERKHLTEHKTLKIFGTLIHNPNLWHLNRYSVARAFSVGLFCAWIPVPFQMVLAAGFAILFHSNLPLSVALVWLTNPATMTPLFYFAYKMGAIILSIPPIPIKFELSYDWIVSTLLKIWEPFLLGCLICGITSAIIGNVAIRLIWRYFTVKHWHNRHERRLARRQKKAAERAKMDHPPPPSDVQ